MTYPLVIPLFFIFFNSFLTWGYMSFQYFNDIIIKKSHFVIAIYAVNIKKLFNDNESIPKMAAPFT